MPSELNVNAVPRSAFGGARFARLDAEFVQAAVLQREEMITRFGGAALSSMASRYNGPVVNAAFADASSEFRYIAIDDVDNDDGLLFPQQISFGSRPSRAKYLVQRGDVLVSNVRPSRGAVALVTARDSGALASSGFTLVRDPAAMQAEVLFACLRTRQLREQLVRRNRGSMYPAVVERDVFEAVVPPLPAVVADGARRAMRLAVSTQDAFFKRLDETRELLEAVLAPYGAPPSPLQSARSSVDRTEIQWSAAFGDGSARRIDAEFFRSEYVDFGQRLQELGPWCRLGELYSLKSGRLKPGDERVATIKQAVLTNAGVNWSAVEWQSGSCAGAQVAPGDILLASTAHEIAYVGKKVDYVTHVPDDVEPCHQVVAEIMVLRPRKGAKRAMPGAYVAAFLRHPAGLHQVQRCIRGLRGGHTYPQDLDREVLVPDPGDEWLENFETIANEADTLRRQAKLGVQNAVAGLESFIDLQILGE